MTQLDEISKSIDALQADVRTLGREVGELKREVAANNKARYQQQGVAWMLRTLWGIGAACAGVVGGWAAHWLRSL